MRRILREGEAQGEGCVGEGERPTGRGGGEGEAQGEVCVYVCGGMKGNR